MSRSRLYPTLQALLAAALFGISSPVSKALLGEVAPIPMAALLYLGSGVGTWLLMRFQDRDAEARLTRADITWLAGALLAGGVAVPSFRAAEVHKWAAIERTVVVPTKGLVVIHLGIVVPLLLCTIILLGCVV